NGIVDVEARLRARLAAPLLIPCPALCLGEVVAELLGAAGEANHATADVRRGVGLRQRFAHSLRALLAVGAVSVGGAGAAIGVDLQTEVVADAVAVPPHPLAPVDDLGLFAVRGARLFLGERYAVIGGLRLFRNASGGHSNSEY